MCIRDRAYPLQERLEDIVFFAYQRWGEDAMLELEGAYSFVISSGKDVFAAKDPLGLSPLFYSKTNDTIWLCLLYTSWSSAGCCCS